MKRIPACAKLNLALLVGSLRHDGKHEVATVMQGLELADRIALERAPTLQVTGFAQDTLVRAALARLADAAGVEPRWAVRITKAIPVAAGLGGGSSDAASSLRAANETLDEPLPPDRLHAIAAEIGADVPFFLGAGPKLASGDGTLLRRLDLPQDYAVLLVFPHDLAKRSTEAVYAAFDERGGAEGFAERRELLEQTLSRVARARDLAELPGNDLATSPLAEKLRRLGAFRADVTGAGPTVYGLFARRSQAERARRALRPVGRTWLTRPAWYV